MAVELNTASRDMLLRAGLTADEVKRIQQFRTDNAVFHSKEELKEHCGFSSERYKEIKDQLTTYPYSQKVRPTEYRRKRGDMKDDWDVGHIVARAKAGADHPANYVPMARDYNQKLRHLHDGVIFAYLSEERVREAVRASRVQNKCLLTFSEALEMKRKALEDLEELQLFREGRGRIAEGVEVRQVPQARAVGGVEVRQVDEDCLCDAEYCERLIREWKEHYSS